MKITKEILTKIIAEEKVRAIVESDLPWSKADFFNLLNEARWYEKLDPNSTAYRIAMAAAREWDAADEKQQTSRNPKRLSMTKDDYMKQAVYDNATAGHKFSRWNRYEAPGSLPSDDPPIMPSEIIMKGYPEEGLPSRKITSTRELASLMRDSSVNPDREYEAYVSPFGYIHAKVQAFDSMGWQMGKNWVYVGDYAISRSGDMIKNDKRGSSYMYPPVSIESLKAERENPSPDRDALWGEGEFAKGTVDVQDPTMEERLISAIKEEIASMGIEQ